MPRHRWQAAIRIIKPLPESLALFRVGSIYEVNTPVSDLLVLAGFAEFVRQPASPEASPGQDRRHNPE